MHVGARRAEPDDLAVLSALAECAIEELTPHRGGAVWSQVEARQRPVDTEMAAQIRDPSTLVLIGTIDTAAVGYAVVVGFEGYDGSAFARVTDLFVLGEARGVGVGECLMESAVSWASDLGAVGIDSIALPGDRETKNFFETFGLVARAIVVHRRL